MVGRGRDKKMEATDWALNNFEERKAWQTGRKKTLEKRPINVRSKM